MFFFSFKTKLLRIEEESFESKDIQRKYESVKDALSRGTIGTINLVIN